MRIVFILWLLNASLFAEKSIEEIFTKFYRAGVWGENGFSLSGAEIGVNRGYVAFLQQFMDKNQITTVVDLGCGDWQFSRTIDWSGIQYIGFDVVKDVIERNKKCYEHSTIVFVHADALEIELPEADLLICKDVLQHLPHADIFRLLKQLHKFKHCLITNDIDYLTSSSKNPDTCRGGYHELDLTKPPFNLPGEKVLTFKAAGFSTKQVLHVKKKA